ncbi:MAG: SUMF1/EgtB/PvdO family nonheme iron enzyme [Gammaproteobacteria bacterium]
MKYLSFDLEINPGRGREYPLEVRSPAGEARETLCFPFDELTLQNRLQALEIALLRAGGRQRRIPSSEEQSVQDFGRVLFDTLLTGEVRIRYDVSLREATDQGKGLRLRLRIQSPELAALPWEFLYDARAGEYLVLSSDTPLVRYLELPRAIRPLTVEKPLRILGMIAAPSDLPALDVERETQRMEMAIKVLREQGLIELTWLPGQSWRDLHRAMRSGPWHVFHFIGHGGFERSTDEGLIALADEDGQKHFLTATHLGRLLANHRPLRLVVLNACEGARGGNVDIFSSTAAILVRRGIPAVIAMQYEITDRAAIEFAHAFYEAVAEGLPVDRAVTEGRIALSVAIANTLEWGTPVLYMRAPDGVLFQITEGAMVSAARAKQQREATPAPKGPVPSAGRLTSASLGAVFTDRLQDHSEGPEMVMLPAGEFWMGSDKNLDAEALDTELPRHRVIIAKAFALGRYPITFNDYDRFAQATGRERPNDIGWGRGNRPVINVSWEDATAYAKWLSQETGKRYRLSTEAEWEYAARAGTETRYWWGNEIGQNRANCNGCGSEWDNRQTAPVGSFGANPFELHDTAGNVWEWVQDCWHENYAGAPSDGSAWETGDCRYRLLRGGSWNDRPRGVRSAARSWGGPVYRSNYLGFRLAQDL